MRKRLGWRVVALLSLGLAVQARAAAQADDEDSTTVSEVTVQGAKPPGSVVGDIKPEVVFSPADIRTYGVSTVTELLDELAPQIRSDRGRGGEPPAVLLNGHRISSLAEVRDIPTEAIQRIDILPEEVALKYGYAADQKVVNIVLRRRFRAITAEGSAGATTDGGYPSGQAEADEFRVRRDARLNLDLKYQASGNLTDAQRGIVQTPGSGPADSRTLLPATQTITANAVAAKPLSTDTTMTVNGSLSANDSTSLLGDPSLRLRVPPTDPFYDPDQPTVTAFAPGYGPIQQQVEGWTAHLGTTINKDTPNWRYSFTAAADHGDTETRTGGALDPAALQALLNAGSTGFNPYGAIPNGLLRLQPTSEARAITNSGNAQVLMNGSLARLPAGALYVSLKAGDTISFEDASSTRLGVFERVNLSRNDFNAQANVDLPIANAARGVLRPVGNLSLNANAAVDELSDFGALLSYGYGANWSPRTGVTFLVSHTEDEAAPTIAQLGDPQLVTPGQPVFDYVTGESVNATVITGGNRGLLADHRSVTKIGLTLKPWSSKDLTFTANYIDSHIRNAIQGFPAADAAIQQAFPDRFIRDASGTLIEEDLRPVNFAESDRQELRYGLNYSRPIGKQPPPRPGFGFRRQGGQGGPPGEGGPRGSGGFGGGGRGGFGGGRGGFFPAGGRLQFAVYHTIFFEDSLLTRPGGPRLDLLNGSPSGNSGGQPRHEVEVQAGFTLNGFGARLSGDWKSGTTVYGDPTSPTGQLSFSNIATANLRVWEDFGQNRRIATKYRWLRGVRATVSVTNLTNDRITVRDAAGVTPLIYQSAYLDPAGRTIRITLRKLFF